MRRYLAPAMFCASRNTLSTRRNAKVHLALFPSAFGGAFLPASGDRALLSFALFLALPRNRLIISREKFLPQIRATCLALSLLMLRVLADNHYLALALNYLALFTHGLNGRSYLPL